MPITNFGKRKSQSYKRRAIKSKSYMKRRGGMKNPLASMKKRRTFKSFIKG